MKANNRIAKPIVVFSYRVRLFPILFWYVLHNGVVIGIITLPRGKYCVTFSIFYTGHSFLNRFHVLDLLEERRNRYKMGQFPSLQP